MFVDVKNVGSIVLYESALESDAKRRLLNVDRCAFLFKQEDIRADG